MAEKIKLLALFEDIEPAAKGTDVLMALGVRENDLQVITGSPINPAMLGRHHPHTNVPRWALAGSISGLLLGIYLAYITPLKYQLNVGGKPISPGASSIVVIFEMIMLLMLIFTFAGVFFESIYPSYERKEYVPEISDGAIAFIFEISPEDQPNFERSLKQAGAAVVRPIAREEV